MRSALSLTLVLLAAMSSQAVSAAELAGVQHPLRLLFSAGYSQSADSAYGADFSFGTDAPAQAAAELHAAQPTSACLVPASEPASRSYECAAVAGVPSRGP